jgi:hypothetical protein
VVDWLNGRTVARNRSGQRVRAGWSTGKVGMIGTSYNGTLPNAVATTGVEGLEAIVSVSAISSWYDYYRAGGAVVAPGGFQGEDTDVLARAVYTRANRTIRWFSHCLYGVDNGINAAPHAYIQRAGHLTGEPEWPSPQAQPVELRLRPRRATATGTLGLARPARPVREPRWLGRVSRQASSGVRRSGGRRVGKRASRRGPTTPSRRT